MLSSKIENAQWAEKTTTTRCGIRETATTQNVELEKSHNAKFCVVKVTVKTVRVSDGKSLANSEREGDLT